MDRSPGKPSSRSSDALYGALASAGRPLPDDLELGGVPVRRLTERPGAPRMKIEHVEVRVIAPRVDRYTWSHDLPEQYITVTLVRIRTTDGVEGVAGVANYTSYEHDRYTAETLRHLIPLLPGMDPLLPEAIRLRLRPRVFPIAPG